MNIREINPIEDRVLIELEGTSKTHSGLLYIPDQAQDRGTHATVLRIGPGKVSQHTLEIMPMSVKPGDKILIGKYTGWELEGEDKHLRMMRNDEVLAIIEEKYDDGHLACGDLVEIITKKSEPQRLAEVIEVKKSSDLSMPIRYRLGKYNGVHISGEFTRSELLLVFHWNENETGGDTL